MEIWIRINSRAIENAPITPTCVIMFLVPVYCCCCCFFCFQNCKFNLLIFICQSKTKIANFWPYVFPTCGLYNHRDARKISGRGNNWTDLSGHNASNEHGILTQTDSSTFGRNGGNYRTVLSANLQILHIQNFQLNAHALIICNIKKKKFTLVQPPYCCTTLRLIFLHNKLKYVWLIRLKENSIKILCSYNENHETPQVILKRSLDNLSLRE